MASRKTLNTFVPNTSKKSASGYKNRADNEAEEIMKDRKTDRVGQDTDK